MSAKQTPHYSHIVHDINSRGGLKMHFARRGSQGEGWLRHLDAIVPENGVIFHELHAVDETSKKAHHAPFHRALHEKALERSAAVLPGGFYGEQTPAGDVPTFKPHELLSLMPKSAAHVSHTGVQQYQELQQIREMRAAVGSLAWLAAHKEVNVDGHNAQPVTLWGRTHSASLPDMYERLGVHSPMVHYLDAPLRYTYLHPHGLNWSEFDIQNAFHVAYQHALGCLSRQAVAA